MDKKQLIQKWLQNDLNDQELESFKKLDDYTELIKLDKGLQYFKAPEYEIKKEYTKLGLTSVKSKKQSNTNWKFNFIKIAAIFVISFFTMQYFFNDIEKNMQTTVAQKTTFNLPDNSKVRLNSVSSIHFKERNWSNSRSLELEGEAYFEVEKGKTFTVNTKLGKIAVLGTKFNVSTRNNKLKVTCFEGSVKVVTTEKEYILKEKEEVVISPNKEHKIIIKENSPFWMVNKSKFRSEELSVVFKDLTKYYNVVLDNQSNLKNATFTGVFTHIDLEEALKNITIPLGLEYKIVNKEVLIFNKEE